MAERRLVRVWRRFEKSWEEGYVVAAEDAWLVLQVLGPGVEFAGYIAFRHRDVTKVKSPAPNVEFVEAVLRKRRQRPTVLAGLDATSTVALLRTAGARFPVVTIHAEEVDRGACHIGRVLEVTSRRLRLQEITPKATWFDFAFCYAVGTITRIDFDGPYERALVLVGGKPDPLSAD